MNVADLTGMTLDYWVARSLYDFVREIYFIDSGTKVAVRGNDRGRPWDGRFLPTVSWEAAGAVLDRVQRIDSHESREEEAAQCTAEFVGGAGPVQARGETAREALLRAFVMSRFGAAVPEMVRQPQVLNGLDAEPVSEPSAVGNVEDLPHPDARIGDIGTSPR